MKNLTGVLFGNGVLVVNTTPHPVTIQDINGSLRSVPQCGVLINAKAVETQVSDLYVSTAFVGDEEGRKIIADIQEWFDEIHIPGERLVILGSIIAAQAYPGQVVAMVPVPGYERVAPAEKRMRCDRFTVFQA